MPSSASQSSNASCVRRDLRRHDRMLPGGRRVSAALSPSGVNRFRAIFGGGGGIRTCDQGLMSPCWHGRRRSPPFDFPRRNAEKPEARTVATGDEPRRLLGRWMLRGCSFKDRRQVEGQPRPWVPIAWSFCFDSRRSHGRSESLRGQSRLSEDSLPPIFGARRKR